MPRTALALAATATLLLNGSMALASVPMPTCSSRTEVCRISLALLAAPPARPADLLARWSAKQASVSGGNAR